MTSEKYSGILALELNIASTFIRNTIKLLEEGATIPFIARYRKEMTGSMDEVLLMKIRDRLIQLKDLDARREVIIKSLTEQEKLTGELELAINDAKSMAELEDLYLPYRPKRKTRASIAKEKGLEPLAKIILSQKYNDIENKAQPFINPEKGVRSVEEAIQGACDIIAEWINEHIYARKRIRWLFQREGLLCSKVAKGKEEEGTNYKNYFDFRELLLKAPSHRLLAILRGENESFLKVMVEVDGLKAREILGSPDRPDRNGNRRAARMPR